MSSPAAAASAPPWHVNPDTLLRELTRANDTIQQQQSSMATMEQQFTAMQQQFQAVCTEKEGREALIKQQVKEAVLSAADACGARAALCADSATGVSVEAEWQAIESALRDEKQILTDELRLPQGSPI